MGRCRIKECRIGKEDRLAGHAPVELEIGDESSRWKVTAPMAAPIDISMIACVWICPIAPMPKLSGA